MIEPILAGVIERAETPYDDLQYVEDLGVIRREPHGAVSNPIYGEIIARMLTASTEHTLPVETGMVRRSGRPAADGQADGCLPGVFPGASRALDGAFRLQRSLTAPYSCRHSCSGSTTFPMILSVNKPFASPASRIRRQLSSVRRWSMGCLNS